MSRIAIVYTNVDYKKNEWFAESLKSNLASFGHEVKVVILGDQEEVRDFEFDFVVYRGRNFKQSESYEKHGIKVFNNSVVSKIANDKYDSFFLAKNLQIPQMSTFLPSNCPLKGPYVIKRRNGHGGSEVYLKDSLDGFNDDYVVQELCSNPGKDMRVFVLGNRIIGAVIRSSTTDFRSNYSLGGKISLGQVSPRQKEAIFKIIDAIYPSFIGIDFIYHKGRWVLNEIEDPVGSRSLYKLKKIDLSLLYAEYIQEEISR